MKKVMAVIVVCMLVMSCTAVFAAKATTSSASRQTQGKGGFWRDFADLFRKQIPDTLNQKSQTNRIWEPTKRGGKKTAK